MIAHDPRIEILGDNALRVRSPLAPALAETISETKLENDESTLVRWTLNNAIALADAGFDAPAPLRKFYQWPAQPFTHQIRTVEFAAVHRRCGIFSEQGTGKSFCGLTLVDYLMKKDQIRRALVVSPVSVMRAAWQRDCLQFTPHLQVGVAHGTPKYRKALLADKSIPIVVINYDALGSFVNEINAGEFDIVIADEANALKNPKALRTKAFAKITSRDDMRVVLMTGTPASQSPEDAYSLARILRNPHIPKNLTAWRDRVLTQRSRFVWVPKESASKDVAQVLAPSIRFTKAECLDLPERTFCDLDAPMSDAQQAAYKQLSKDLLTSVGAGTVTAGNAAILIGKLLQISAGAVRDEERDAHTVECEPRVTTLLDTIAQASAKVIVFANYTAVIDMLVARLNAEGIRTEKLDGSVSMNARAALVQRFQMSPASMFKVMVIQPQAAAHGITLTAADTVVWWGPPVSVELYKQANDRPHRIGQTNKVTVYHLLSSPAERRTLKALRNNISVHEAAVELFNDLAYGVDA